MKAKFIFAVVEKKYVQFKFDTTIQNVVENFMLMIGHNTNEYYLSLIPMKDYTIHDVKVKVYPTDSDCIKYELIY